MNRLERRKAFVAVFGLIVAATVVACGDNVSVPQGLPGGGGGGIPPMEGVASKAASRDMMAVASAPAASPEAVSQGASPSDALRTGPATDSVAAQMIIRNAQVSVQVDSLERAIAAVQAIAKSLNGFVGNTSLATGEYQVRSATIEVKIPSARYDEALNGIKPLGKVESVQSNTQDVGEEFVDVSVRMASGKKLEQRLLDLLATRTGKLEDVLAVERELARVREEIERYEGRVRYLKSRVAISTITITVHERAPLVSATPGDNVMLQAFRDAWRGFVRFIAGLIASMGVLIPMGVIGYIIYRIWRANRSKIVKPVEPPKPE